MQATELSYLYDSTIFSEIASVIQCIEENGRNVVICDRTIFYPQGGGQPYDTGIMESTNGQFRVEEVRFIDGIVKHIGAFTRGTFQAGDKVTQSIDTQRRLLHSRLHSGGHVVDMAVDVLGLSWIPGKAYHFPDGPYVEYAGTLTVDDKERVKASIEEQCNKFVDAYIETKNTFMNKADMHKVCRFVPDYLPINKPSRVVMYGDFGIPCGGTHVTNLHDIGHITIRKVSTKGDVIRVSYQIV